VWYYRELMRGLRQAIRDGRLAAHEAEVRAAWTGREDLP
jgi:queuine/archaeosine tRNA-ribosyltransferase